MQNIKIFINNTNIDINLNKDVHIRHQYVTLELSEIDKILFRYRTNAFSKILVPNILVSSGKSILATFGDYLRKYDCCNGFC